MQNKRFAVVGGDFRNLTLAELFTQDSSFVSTFALSDDDCATLELAVKDADVVVGPIPFTNDNKTLNTPLYREPIFVNDFFKTLNKKSIFFSGKLDESTLTLARKYMIRTVDILIREDFAILNAIPTGEGILEIAMRETFFTLNSSNILIVGYGRVGKTTAMMLRGLGANVYVAAKPFHEQSYAVTHGMKIVDFDEMKQRMHHMDILINTVPVLVVTEEILKNAKKNCLLIDIASKPGGIDFEKARELGLKTIWALSLPGKVAPMTSAKIVRDTVLNVLREAEV